MLALTNISCSPEEYLAWENRQPEKHEYVDGEVFAMVGATRRHNTIAQNVAFILRSHLLGSPCVAYIGEVKLRIAFANAYYYPDVMIACGPDNAAANDSPVVEDAVLVVEVLSPSTEAIDRREKLQAYRRLPGLREYILIAQDRIEVVVHRRSGDDRWESFAYEPGDTVDFASVGLAVPMDAIYAGIVLD